MNYGFLSLLPSLLAIVLALTTKNVFLALMASLLFGNLLLADYNLIGMLVGTKDILFQYIHHHYSDPAWGHVLYD